LVQTECYDGFWFDRVIHLLHVQDDAAERTLLDLPNHHLAACPPTAWVDTKEGTARFPLQYHLASLKKATVDRCIEDLRTARNTREESPPSNYREALESTFGRTLCELFFFPYNRKMWKRPLREITAAPTFWTLHRPSLDEITRGAQANAATTPAYNSNAFYPRPPSNSAIRGMEIISAGMAKEVADLRLNHEIIAIHPRKKCISVRTASGEDCIAWEKALISSLPLPTAIELCDEVPEGVSRASRNMEHNLVVSVGLSIRGRRPSRGHWRYYPDENLPFTRLVFLHEFDSELAPEDGWPLLAEIPLPAHSTLSHSEICDQVIDGVQACGVLEAGNTIEAVNVLVADPAYVCFTDEGIAAAELAREFLRGQTIEPLGRYGNWEYSSMAQVIASGMALAKDLLARDAS